MSSRGVFRIIGGTGAFITASFEETISMHDFWVEDKMTAKFEDSMEMKDSFVGLIPTVHMLQAGDGFSMNDEAIRINDILAFGEAMEIGDAAFALNPVVHTGVAVETFNKMNDEFSIPAMTATADTMAEQDTVSMGDTFECWIE
jgi:hypothetical protein